MSTTATTPRSSTTGAKLALFKRQNAPVELIEETIAESDTLLGEHFPGCLDGALAVRERFKQDGNRVARDKNGVLPREGQLVVTVVTQAVLEMEGQRIPVEDLDDVRTVASVRETAVMMESWAGQALIDWTVETWIAIVKVIKQAGPKGNHEDVLRVLLEGPEEWCSALTLDWQLAMQQALGQQSPTDIFLPEMQEKINQAIEVGERAVEETDAAFKILKEGPAEPSPYHIIGF